MVADLLRGERVRLTGLGREDLPLIAAWQQDGEFLRLLDAAAARPKTAGELVDWLEELQKSREDILFGIRPLDSGHLLGFVVLDDIVWPQRNAWLTVAIGDRANWGKGYGTDALRLALRFAFHELNLRRVQLTVFSYNTRAIATYERLGFQREGVFREYLERDGELYDMYLYGLLKREWAATLPPTERDRIAQDED